MKKAKNKLELLLVEANKETIRENIPEAAREKCMDAWSMANNICLRIKQAISQKKRKNWKEYCSAAKKSLPRIKAMEELLASILNALKDA